MTAAIPGIASRVRSTVSAIAPLPSDWWGPRLAVLIVLAWIAGLASIFYVSLTMLTITGFIVAAIGFVRPSVGLLGVGIICTVDSLSRTLLMSGGLLRFNTFNYLLIAMIILALPLLERLRDPQTRILEGFLVLAVLGVAVSGDRSAGAQHLLNIMAPLGLMLFFMRARHDDRIYYWAGLLNGLVSGIGSMVFFIQIDRMPWVRPDSQDRFVNANAFSYFPLTGLFSVCMAFPLASRRDQTKLGLLAIANMLWVFLSGSRGSMLVALCCLAYLLSTSKGVSRQAVFVLVAPLAAMAALSTFGGLQEHAMHRITKLFDSSYSLAGRTSGRTDVAIVGWRMFLRHPLGVGTGGFATEYAVTDADELAFAGTHKQAHSGWVKTLAENGVVGLAMLIIYVWSFAFSSRHKTGVSVRAMGLLVSTVFSIAFFSAEFQGKGLWFLAVGATVLMHYRSAPSRQEVLVIR
jgi:hypothetical protein